MASALGALRHHQRGTTTAPRGLRRAEPSADAAAKPSAVVPNPGADDLACANGRKASWPTTRTHGKLTFYVDGVAEDSMMVAWKATTSTRASALSCPSCKHVRPRTICLWARIDKWENDARIFEYGGAPGAVRPAHGTALWTSSTPTYVSRTPKPDALDAWQVGVLYGIILQLRALADGRSTATAALASALGEDVAPLLRDPAVPPADAFYVPSPAPTPLAALSRGRRRRCQPRRRRCRRRPVPTGPPVFRRPDLPSDDRPTWPSPQPTNVPTGIPTTARPTALPSSAPTVSPAPTSHWFQGSLIAYYDFADGTTHDIYQGWDGTPETMATTEGRDGGTAIALDHGAAVTLPPEATRDVLGDADRTVCVGANRRVEKRCLFYYGGDSSQGTSSAATWGGSGCGYWGRYILLVRRFIGVEDVPSVFPLAVQANRRLAGSAPWPRAQEVARPDIRDWSAIASSRRRRAARGDRERGLHLHVGGTRRLVDRGRDRRREELGVDCDERRRPAADGRRGKRTQATAPGRLLRRRATSARRGPSRRGWAPSAGAASL